MEGNGSPLVLPLWPSIGIYLPCTFTRGHRILFAFGICYFWLEARCGWRDLEYEKLRGVGAVQNCRSVCFTERAGRAIIFAGPSFTGPKSKTKKFGPQRLGPSTSWLCTNASHFAGSKARDRCSQTPRVESSPRRSGSSFAYMYTYLPSIGIWLL